MSVILFITLLIFLGIWASVCATLMFLFNKEKTIDKLKYYDEDYAMKEKIKDGKKGSINILKVISNIIPKSKLNKKKAKSIEIEIVKADLPLTVEEFMVIKVLSTSFFSFLVFLLSKDYFVTILVLILVWNAPRFIIEKMKKGRVREFDSQLNEGITIISNSLKAGYSFLQAIAVVSEQTRDPFAKEFKKLLKEMSLGISEEEALRNLLNRIESEDLRLIVNAILIQKDIGGNLSEILDNISDTIRERQKIKNELKTLTAQGKLSGIVVALIPIFLGMTIYLFNKEYMMLLFKTPIGLVMVSVAVVSEVLGLFMIRKIINIDM